MKASPFYPDGYYLHRSFWVVRNEILEKHPKVAVAFVMAQQKALEDLMKLPGEQVSELVKKYWELPPAAGKQIVQDEVLFLRGWIFPTEGDAWALVETCRWENDGQLSAGGLRRDEGRIILSRAHGLSADDLARRGIGAGLYIVLNGGDIDALYAAVQGRATVLTPIGDRPWGDRTFEIADPDGYRVEVAKTLG